MGRPRRLRRFDPFGGVSQHIVDLEASYVSREAADYRLQSLNQLREWLDERRRHWSAANASLAKLVEHCSDREQLIVQCLLVRDLHHLLELYLAYLRREAPEDTSPGTTEVELPFNEWLFGPTGGAA
jgi:hypothetical protein